MGRLFSKIYKEESRYRNISIKGYLKLVTSVVLMIGLSVVLYRVPYLLFRGVSWAFLFVWLPNTIQIALYLIFISIYYVYIYSIFKGL